MVTPRAMTVALLTLATASITVAMPATHAAPDGFPDLSAFTPVDPKPYISRNGGGMSAIVFQTDNDIACSWYASSDPSLHTTMHCDGHIPGLPTDTTTGGGCPGVSVPRMTPGAPYELASHGFPCPPFRADLAILHPGQRITETNITCAVGTDNMLACIDYDQNHGFVLQPSGSFAF